MYDTHIVLAFYRHIYKIKPTKSAGSKTYKRKRYNAD